MSIEILAMFPGGVAARCYDCQAVHQVRDAARVVSFDHAINHRVRSQVPWHPFGMKCVSCGR